MPDEIRSVSALIGAAAGAGVLSFTGLLAYSVFVPRCQFWAPVLRGIPQRDAVALTFDDGPDERFTPQILDCLAEYQVKATFFVIGRFAKNHPALVKRIFADGHVLGNHSLDHDRFGVKRNRAYWREQIGQTQKIVGDIVGIPPYLFRPPRGFKTWHIAGAVKELGLPVVGWSLRGGDAKNEDAAGIVNRVLRRIGGHDIVVLHDGVEPGLPGGSREQTVKALPHILSGLQEKKLQTLTLLEAFVPDAKSAIAGGAP